MWVLDCGYLDFVVLLCLLLEHLQDDMVLQRKCLCGAPVFILPLPELLLVGWVPEVSWWVPHEVGLDGNSENLLLNLLNLSSLLQFVYLIS